MVSIEDFYGSRLSTVNTEAELQPNGQWKITVEIIQKRRKKLEDEWETKEMHCTAFNDDVDRAVAEASITVSTYLDSLAGDLFNAAPKKDYEVISQ
jgi:hypothetical protein